MNTLKKVFGFEGILMKERAFLVLIISVLVSVWFSRGLILGSGESGLPFYNTDKLLVLSQHMWSDTPLGNTSAIGYASLPFYIVVETLLNLKVPAFLLQALMYWLIFTTGVISVHKIASSISENTPVSRLSSSLFYIFNPIVHVAVLHRFQYPMIFFYGFAPLALYIYYSGLKRRSLVYPIVLSLLSVVFSFAFVGLAFLELLFLMFGLLSAGYFLRSIRFKKMSVFSIIYFAAFCIVYLLVNFWWIAPLLSSYITPDSGGLVYFNPSGNIDTFKIISQNLGSVISVFRLFPVRFYESDGSVWGWIYYTKVFVTFSFFFILSFLLGLFKRKKDFLFIFLSSLAVLVMFLMKGSLPPFGEISLSLMSLFTPLQVFRNPFEKIGLILPLAMAIPIGFGVDIAARYLKRKINHFSVAATAVILIFFPLYSFPIVNGLVFTGGGKPSEDINIGQYVKVPDYYKEAHDFFNKQGDLFRIIALPIDGEGMTYNWEYGYSGVELSNTLFDQSVISFETGQVFLPEMISMIKEVFLRFPDKFWVISQILNTKYVVIRDDIDYVSRDLESPVADLIIMNDKLKDYYTKKADFGKLQIFEINKNLYTPRIYAGNTPIFISGPSGLGLKLLPFSNPEDKDIFITPQNNLHSIPIIELSKQLVIGGENIENLEPDPSKKPQEELPFISFARNSKFYFLIKAKEWLESTLLSTDKKLGYQINLLWKRLSEINQNPKDTKVLAEYGQLLSEVEGQLSHSNPENKEYIYNLFRQQYALSEISKKSEDTNDFEKIDSKLNMILTNWGVKSNFPTKKSLITRFYVPKSSKYEILISKENWDRYYGEFALSEYELDGKSYSEKPEFKGDSKDAFSLGFHNLSEGIHELGIDRPKAKNLIAEELPNEIVLQSEIRKPFEKYIPLIELDKNYKYQLTFEYLEEKGNIPVVAISSDVDFVDKKGERFPRFGVALSRNYYDFGWKKQTVPFTPVPSSNIYNVLLKLTPYGSCKAEVHIYEQRRCEDPAFNQRFLKESVARVRNLKVEKVFTNPILLRESKRSLKNDTPKIEFSQVSPARYKVKVEDANSPFFLILSTAFDPSWDAYFLNPPTKNITGFFFEDISGEKIPAEKHLLVNGYSNGWFIDRKGSFEIYLDYTPEKVLNAGQKVSFAVLIILISFLIFWGVYARNLNR